MNKKILPIAILGILSLVACSKKDDGKPVMDTKPMNQTMIQQNDSMGAESNLGDMEMGSNVVYYTCPMESHKHIHKDKPGKCPECNMGLIAVENTDIGDAEFFGCPMPSHSHVRKDHPGKCDECGMNLQPMKMKKS